MPLSSIKHPDMEEEGDMSSDLPVQHRWPPIQVPSISLSRFLTEKLVSFSKQIFLVDHRNQIQFYYHDVFLDALRTVQLYKANRISSESTIGIIGNGCYEHIVNFLAAILVDAKLVLLDCHLNKGQLSRAIKGCGITSLVVGQNQPEVVGRFKRKCPNHFTVSFGQARKQSSDYYHISEILPVNAKEFGTAADLIHPGADRNRIRVLVPQFRDQKLVRILKLTEFGIISQLTYAMLPQCGFEWNMNDIVLAANPLSTVIGMLELLTTVMTGARIVINHWDGPATADSLIAVIEQNRISACILDSSYLMETLSDNGADVAARIGSLRKILFIRQPLHRSLAYAFRTNFNIFNCRFAFYLPEATGLAAIEIANYGNGTTVVPMPLMNIRIVDLHDHSSQQQQGQLGKIYLKSPYMARLDEYSIIEQDQWIDSGYLGYHDCNGQIQIIDHYNNFFLYKQRWLSKGLVQIIVLAHPAVRQCLVASDSQNTTLKILVQLDKTAANDDQQSLKLQLQNFLEEQLGGIQWEFEFVFGDGHSGLPFRNEFFDSENIIV